MAKVESKTVADFGVPESIRRAQDLEEYQGVKHIIDDAAITSNLTQTPVAQPYNPPELKEVTGDPTTVAPYALFSPPQVTHSKSNLFAADISPSLGPVEKQEEDQDSLIPFTESQIKEFPTQKDAINKESQTLQQNLNHLRVMGINLRYANNNRNCTQKG